MWSCKHCNQEFEYVRNTEKANHSRHCDSNPKKKESYTKLRAVLQVRFDTAFGEHKQFTVSCSCCNVKFSVTEREFQHPLKEQYFCSRKCSNSVGGNARSKKYWNDDTAHYATVAWRHHEKKCVVCGEERIVAVHHYNENHDDNDPKNLIPLCPTHHLYMHSRHKIEIIEIVDTYIKDKWGQGVDGGMPDLHSGGRNSIFRGSTIIE